MDPSPASLPDQTSLEIGLRSALSVSARVEVLQRGFNDYSRTFASEIVTCRLPNGREERLFCKYMFALNEDHRDHGSRGGVVYEAMVYDRVLRSLPMTIPAYHGTYIDAATGAIWLILGHVDSAVDLDCSADETAIVRAAAWIGSFHRYQQQQLSSECLPTLSVYNAAFYRGWARRTTEFAAGWHSRFPWLPQLCERFEDVVKRLQAAPPTVIHGEYYPHNILVRGEAIYPVDWESAAIAVGEIDLASLTDGWSEDTTRTCEDSYCQARWPEGAPAAFSQVIASARLYLQLRWIGNQPEWSEAENMCWRIEDLGRAGAALGLINP